MAAANDIVEVIGGYFPLKRAGTTYKALCPFHQERSPSFTVNPARQIFKCFGCGAGGSVFRFVMDYEHLDFGAALRRLAERAGIRIEEQELSSEDRQKIDLRRRLLDLHRAAAEYFHKTLLKSPAAQHARDYLKSRGIQAEIAKSWQLGYAPEGWDVFSRWARQQGFSNAELLAGGLTTPRDPENPSSDSYDRFRDRIMFPICNDTGEVIAFSGRILQPEAKAAKYVNSPETPLFTKGAVLYGLHRSKRALIEKNSAIVCEGQLDLITAFEAGIQNVIAPQGTAFTPKQARILRRYVNEVVLCFDSDAAGEKAAERSLPSLLAEKLAVRVIRLPSGQDPDSLIRSQGAAAFFEQVSAAEDFFEAQLRRVSESPQFHTPRGKTAAARKLAEFVSWITDPILREMQIQSMARRVGLGAEEFSQVVRDAGKQHRRAPAHSDDAEPASAPGGSVREFRMDSNLLLLGLVLTHSREAREWLSEEDWHAQLEAEPEAELLLDLMESAHSLENPEGFTAFLARLDPQKEALMTSFLSQRPPENPLTVVEACWRELDKKRLRRAMDSLKARQREPHLSLEEATNLHQQILDLQKRLFDISRPFSPLQ